MNTNTIKFRFILFIVLCSFRLNASDTLSLNEAITKKQVSVSITGMDPIKGFDVVHYGECIKIKIINLTDKIFNIRIEPGRMLKSKDATVQNMVLSKKKIIPMPAKKEVNLKLFAFCAEYTKSTPTAANTFTVGDMCSNELKKIVTEIETLNYQNDIGQFAVWCATDNLPLTGLTDLCKDKVKAAPLFRAVCKAQHIPIPKVYANAKVSQRVNFNYTLSDTAMVKIILYDNVGNMVLNFLTAIDKPKGDYKESYWISDADIEPGHYLALLYVDGVPMITEEIDF